MPYVLLTRIRTETTNYLLAKDLFKTKTHITISIFVLFLWAIIVNIASLNHEMSRDEVRALTTALEPASIWLLPFTVDDGHPVLWFFILRFFYSVFPSPVILKVISLVIAIVSVFLFYRFSPFKGWQKILFILGILPFYEYSVMARNYGISMMLFFVFAILYPMKRKRWFALSITLAFLANANFMACMMTGSLLAIWMFEEVAVERNALSRDRIKNLGIAYSIVIIGVLLCLYTTFPSENSILTGALSKKPVFFFNAFWDNLVHPGSNFNHIFPYVPVIVREILMWGLITGLLVRPHTAVVAFGSAVLLGTFFATVYSCGLRHEGVFFVFLITLFWIILDQDNSDPANKKKYQEVSILKYFLVPIAKKYKYYINSHSLSFSPRSFFSTLQGQQGYFI